MSTPNCLGSDHFWSTWLSLEHQVDLDKRSVSSANCNDVHGKLAISISCQQSLPAVGDIYSTYIYILISKKSQAAFAFVRRLPLGAARAAGTLKYKLTHIHTHREREAHTQLYARRNVISWHTSF